MKKLKMRNKSVRHKKDCHLGDNHKDCPACVEIAADLSPTHQTKRKASRQPTPAKLPKARVGYGLSEYAGTKCQVIYSKSHGNKSAIAFAVIPCHTAAQAHSICKAAPFLLLSEEEQVERVAAAIANDPDYADNPSMCIIFERDARDILRAMNMGGGK